MKSNDKVKIKIARRKIYESNRKIQTRLPNNHMVEARERVP